MKKVKIVIIIILIIILSTALVIGVINLKDYLDTRNEILNLNFEMPKYKTVNEIIYYEETYYEDSIIEDLSYVAEKLKNEYPDKKVVLSEIEEESDYLEYKFNQIIGEEIIKNSTVTAHVGEENKIYYNKNFKGNNIVGDDINNVKINSEEATEKFKNYLLENMENYKEWNSGLYFFYRGNGRYSIRRKNILEFYQYEGKATWKFNLETGNYVVMDANNGEILYIYYNYTGPINMID